MSIHEGNPFSYKTLLRSTNDINRIYCHTFNEVNKKYMLVDLKQEKLSLHNLVSHNKRSMNLPSKTVIQSNVKTRNVQGGGKMSLRELQTYLNRVSESTKILEKELEENTVDLSKFNKRITIHRNQSSTQYREKPKILDFSKPVYIKSSPERKLGTTSSYFRPSPVTKSESFKTNISRKFNKLMSDNNVHVRIGKERKFNSVDVNKGLNKRKLTTTSVTKDIRLISILPALPDDTITSSKIFPPLSKKDFSLAYNDLIQVNDKEFVKKYLIPPAEKEPLPVRKDKSKTQTRKSIIDLKEVLGKNLSQLNAEQKPLKIIALRNKKFVTTGISVNINSLK